jgi:hypothetical protein
MRFPELQRKSEGRRKKPEIGLLGGGAGELADRRRCFIPDISFGDAGEFFSNSLFGL